jgi:hypothetical protein
MGLTSAQGESTIESMTMAIFAERCPGMRIDERDRELYRKAAIAALTTLGIL